MPMKYALKTSASEDEQYEGWFNALSGAQNLAQRKKAKEDGPERYAVVTPEVAKEDIPCATL